jgi:hypothetical protein
MVEPKRILERILRSSKITVADLRNVSPEQGVYIFWTNGSPAACLKVGIAGPRRGKGLRERLRLHWSSNLGNSVLARHLAADSRLTSADRLDFRNRETRRAFLAEKCCVQALPIPGVTRKELLAIESFLVAALSPAYVGRVLKRTKTARRSMKKT